MSASELALPTNANAIQESNNIDVRLTCNLIDFSKDISSLSPAHINICFCIATKACQSCSKSPMSPLPASQIRYVRDYLLHEFFHNKMHRHYYLYLKYKPHHI